MKLILHSIVVFIFISSISSLAQSIDSIRTPQSNFAILCIYHPKNGFYGSMSVYLGDSVICRSNYNSRDEIKVYKEGKAELWTKPKNENSLLIDIKFGEKYFVKCQMLPAGKTTKMKIELVDSIKAKREYYSIRSRDSIRAIKELDTVQRRNTIYAELGGQALAYSLNYDRIFIKKRKITNSFSIGISVFPECRGPILFTPTSYNFLFGKKNNHFVLGIGATPYIHRQKRYTFDYGCNYYEGTAGYGMGYIFFASPKIGYRYQKLRGGIFFSITFSPIINVAENFGYVKFKDEPEFNRKGEWYFFNEIWWEGIPAIPWAGISIGYSFNFKKK